MTHGKQASPPGYTSTLHCPDRPPCGAGKLDARRRVGPALLNWAQSANVTLDPELRRAIEDGFPNDDAFDATVGLVGMLEVLMNRRESGELDDEKVRKLEGWILGQSCAP